MMPHEFEYRLDINKNLTKMTKKMSMFENGDAEMWYDRIIEFNDLISLPPLVTSNQKVNVAPCLV
jgi:hypothetical protein